MSTYIPVEYDEAIKAHARTITVEVEIDFPESSHPTTFFGDDIVDFFILKEASGSSKNPLGTVTSNELFLSLNNHDRSLTPSNPYRLYTVKPGLEVRPFLIVELPYDYVRIPLGTYWTNDWDTPSDSTVAFTIAHDRLIDIINLDTPQIPPMVNTSIGAMFGRLFRAIGLGIDEYIISPALTQPVKVGWWRRDLVLHSLQTLAEAGNCFVSVNRDNQIIVMPNFRTGDPIVEYTGDDMLFSINNPQRILDTFNAVKTQYRVPFIKEKNINMVRADNVLIPAGGVTLDRIDFHGDDIPVMEVTRVYIYKSKDVQPEVWDLYLNGPTGGTYDLGYGGSWITFLHNDNADTIESGLEVLYGCGSVSVEGADGDFTITFLLGIESELEADFSNLTDADAPYLLLRQEYISPLVSEVESISWGATDIVLVVVNSGAVAEEINIEVEGIGTGHHIGHNVIRDEPAIDDYGYKELSLENHLIQSQAVAKKYSELLLEHIKDPMAWFEFENRGDPLIEVGDILRIESATDEIPPVDVMVTRIKLRYDGGLSSTIRARRVL